MSDKFQAYSEGLNSPPSCLDTVTPSDSADLPNASRSLNAATSGAVRVTTVNGDTETVFLAAGIAFPLRVRRIWATGTSATGLVVMY